MSMMLFVVPAPKRAGEFVEGVPPSLGMASGIGKQAMVRRSAWRHIGRPGLVAVVASVLVGAGLPVVVSASQATASTTCSRQELGARQGPAAFCEDEASLLQTRHVAPVLNLTSLSQEADDQQGFRPSPFAPRLSFVEASQYGASCGQSEVPECQNSDDESLSMAKAKELCLRPSRHCSAILCKRGEGVGDECSVCRGPFKLPCREQWAVYELERLWPDGSVGVVAPGVGTGPWTIKDGVWHNWPETAACTPANIHYPSSEKALQQILLQAGTQKRKVKVWGGGLSLSGVAACDDGVTEMVSIFQLNRTLKVRNSSEHDLSITVQGGMRMKELLHAMDEAGLAFGDFPVVHAQSVAGFMSTCSHGSEASTTNIAGFVLGVRLMLANGTTLAIDKQSPDLLNAAACSIGALGIITEVTLRCIPTFSWGPRVGEWTDGVEDNVSDTVRAFEDWEPERTMRLWTWSVGTPGHRRRGGMERVNHARCSDPSGEGCQLWWRAIDRAANGLVYAHKVREMEFAVDVSRVPGIFETFSKYVESHRELIDGNHSQWHLLARFAKGDDAWMSPAYGRDSTYVTWYMECIDPSRTRHDCGMTDSAWCADGKSVPCDTPALTKQYDTFGRKWEQIVYSVGGGRPHWGKENHANSTYLETVYPKFAAFVDLTKELDPHGMFMNQYLRQRLYDPTE
mmetsp:Transcript_175124/g.561613  ORF Transcript_175124/g.561613 Transcript_175124/m.561613 type:complete len:683 (+) Transcript_175124:38-2086(+)